MGKKGEKKKTHGSIFHEASGLENKFPRIAERVFVFSHGKTFRETFQRSI